MESIIACWKTSNSTRRKRSDRMEATATHLRPKKCSPHFEFVSSKTSAHNCHRGLLRAIFIFCIFDYLLLYCVSFQVCFGTQAVKGPLICWFCLCKNNYTKLSWNSWWPYLYFVLIFYFACTKLAPHSCHFSTGPGRLWILSFYITALFEDRTQ